MANIKSQTKRIQTNLKAEVHNFTFKASMRTAIKKTKALLDKKDLNGAKSSLNLAIKLIDKSVAHGIQKSQTASRQKSRLMNYFNNHSKSVAS